MIDRRNALAGLGCIAAIGAAEFLRPRRKLVLMPEGAKLADLVPGTVGAWSAGEGGDIVVPRTEGTLASRLYTDQVARTYRDETGTRPEIMVVVAYGAAQNDTLQLHRPEVCYPAIGFEIADRRLVDLDAGGGRKVPAVALTAQAGERFEDILYWTRVGNDLPRTNAEQRDYRFRSALAGYVGDGVLFRASAVRTDGKPQFGPLTEYLETLIALLQPKARLALLGQSFAA